MPFTSHVLLVLIASSLPSMHTRIHLVNPYRSHQNSLKLHFYSDSITLSLSYPLSLSLFSSPAPDPLSLSPDPLSLPLSGLFFRVFIGLDYIS